MPFQVSLLICHSALDAESIINQKLDSRLHENDKILPFLKIYYFILIPMNYELPINTFYDRESEKAGKFRHIPEKSP